MTIHLLGRGTLVRMVTLVSPLNNATAARDTVSFKWRKATPAATKYWFEWSTSHSFTERTIDSTLTDTMNVASGFPKNSTIHWRVRAGNQLGWGEYSLSRTFFRPTTSVPEAGTPPAYSLLPNYPNPFNLSTTISFTVPRTTLVRIDVHNAAGELVGVIADAPYLPGEHRIVFDGAGLPSGMYFARMRAGSVVQVRPMLLMK
ncbi:MAG: T9SS type A sorting domain-containing protein [Ignavibacteriae bacterium]|nr:T9SS type A sorting domain-containing protein [Ignavibacteriota bacterium]